MKSPQEVPDRLHRAKGEYGPKTFHPDFEARLQACLVGWTEEQLRAILDEMTEDNEAYIMVRGAGIPIQGVADALGVSTRTVNRRVTRMAAFYESFWHGFD